MLRRSILDTAIHELIIDEVKFSRCSSRVKQEGNWMGAPSARLDPTVHAVSKHRRPVAQRRLTAAPIDSAARKGILDISYLQ